MQGNGLQLYLFIYSVFQDKGVVVASTETEAAEQIRLPVSGLLPVKRPRLQMRDKEKENSKEANNKEFHIENPSRRGRGPHLKTYSGPMANSQQLLQSAPTVQKSFVIGESNEQAVTSSEISINKGDQNNPINMPSVKENFDKPSSYHSNNGIKHRNNKTYKKEVDVC